MAEVTIHGLRLHLQDLGPHKSACAPVLFLHGLVMDNLSSWFFTVAGKTAARQRTLLYDLRGHGRSERPRSGYHLDLLVAECVGVLDALEIDGPVQVVGNSFGGLLALVLALEHPAHVERLALVDALLPEAGWAAAMAATLSLEGEAANARIATDFKRWLGRHSSRKRTRLADSARALVKETSLLADLRASATYADEAYARIEVPVLALYGEHSDQREAGERLAGQLPRGTLEIIPGATHSLLWEATEHLCERLLTFLQDPPGLPRG